MDGRGGNQHHDGRRGVPLFIPPQAPTMNQIPPGHGGAHLASPIIFNTIPRPLMPFQPPPLPVGGVPPMIMDGGLPTGGLPIFCQQPGFNTYGPVNHPVPTTPYHRPTAPHVEVLFDPRTPPPFADRAQMQTPRRHGVLKITNIPYTISISEMHQFITRYVPIPHLIAAHVDGYPTHIIMERSTGKTMDAYVEIESPEVAAADWEHSFGLKHMRIPKMGQRNVEVYLSSQGELMRDLFPRAKCIIWDNEENGAPKLVPNRDIYSSGFTTFLTTEEMTCMVRHAEAPQRSQFASRSMNRPYECMISTCYKFPWGTVKLWTMRHGQDLYNAFKRQLDSLLMKLTMPNVPREVGLDTKLIMDLIFAGLNAPGFSERQKAAIVDCCAAVGTGFPISTHAPTWPFLTLTIFPYGMSDADVALWLEVLYTGMAVMESQDREFIGIQPYLQVTRDETNHIIFTALEEGLDLKRAQFSILEQRMMEKLFHLGWAAYLPEHGFDAAAMADSPTTQAINESLRYSGPPIDPYGVAGSAAAIPPTGHHPVNKYGHHYAAGGKTGATDPDQDQEFHDAGNTGVSNDSFNDPQKALAAMRQVVNQVRDAPPADQDDVDAARGPDDGARGPGDGGVGCLGAALDTITLNNLATPPRVARYVPPARRSTAPGVVQGTVSFNPETPAFNPGGFQYNPIVDGRFLAPPTGYTGHITGHGNVLTAPASEVNLNDAPTIVPLLPAFQAYRGEGNRVITQGDVAAAQALRDLAANAAERAQRRLDAQGDSPTPSSVESRHSSTSGASSSGTATAIPAPDANPQLNIARTRPSVPFVGPRAVRPAAGTDGSFDDTLDELFDERTDELTRMVITAGMNMRTDSAGTLAPPSTPPPQTAIPRPALHRSPAREQLRDEFEFDEAVTAGPSRSTHATRFHAATAHSAPATPVRQVFGTPGPTVYDSGNSSSSGGTFHQLASGSQGTRLVHSPLSESHVSGPRISPDRYANSTPHYTGTPQTTSVEDTPGTPGTHARRLAAFQARIDRYADVEDHDD